jgi:hypothetical protein
MYLGILLVALIVVTSVSGYLIYSGSQRIEYLESSLANANAQNANLQSELESTRQNLTRANGLVQEYAVKEARNPTRSELLAVLPDDILKNWLQTTAELNTDLFGSWEGYMGALCSLKETLLNQHIRTAMVRLYIEGESPDGTSEERGVFLLVADLADGGRVYFSPYKAALYSSPEDVIMDWGLGYSQVHVLYMALYWD